MSGGTMSAATPVQPQLRPGQGRLYLPDVRDRMYEATEPRIRALVKAETGKAPVKRTLPWKIKKSLDQGRTDECVIHFGAHSLQASPIFHDLNWPRSKLTEYYDRARQIDGFPVPHDGTTARAMATVFRQEGFISEYLWIFDEDTLKEHLAIRGTVGAGTDWFSTMFDVDQHGYLEPGGNVEGGHEFLIRWYHGPKHRTHPDSYECQNSWGEEWGVSGNFFLKADTLQYLVFALNGDLILMTEQAVVKKMAKAA